ncbi:HPr family phosphocarrier protein [Halosolutus gelatinilyticus]|uniref:HPr family phosphocarrier protein n=1 Tax=Halosolutus gelatinilyticus TaxID=2931975 RepID=UPI001FF3F17C|nr:HPr family phosphocarrier protein [Halosolutus gelatinilyticus]
MERIITVVPEAGLHARPASEVVQTATEYESEVTIAPVDSEETVDARSMLAVAGLSIECGDEVRLVAEGADAETALDALVEILTTPESDAGEPER